MLDGREAYARAAWLLLLLALPGVATILYLLFGEPWISAALRRRAREAAYRVNFEITKSANEISPVSHPI